jgi:hypothetical protein
MIKIFIQYEGSQQKYIKRRLETITIGEEIQLEIKLDKKSSHKKPRGCDIYLLHWSQTNEKEVKKIRKENPKSLICALYGGGNDAQVKKELGKFFDEVYISTPGSFIEEPTLERMIDRIKSTFINVK